MVIEGKIHQIGDTQHVSDTFKKRDFVVEYVSNPLYPQYVTFQAIQDRCALLDSYHEGDRIAVDFNLRGREWTSPQGEKKYFNTLEAWRINPAQEAEAILEAGQAIASDQWSDQASDVPF